MRFLFLLLALTGIALALPACSSCQRPVKPEDAARLLPIDGLTYRFSCTDRYTGQCLDYYGSDTAAERGPEIPQYCEPVVQERCPQQTAKGVCKALIQERRSNRYYETFFYEPESENATVLFCIKVDGRLLRSSW
jgi:recombinational DNA repair protein (RecF pathway)